MLLNLLVSSFICHITLDFDSQEFIKIGLLSFALAVILGIDNRAQKSNPFNCDDNQMCFSVVVIMYRTML